MAKQKHTDEYAEIRIANTAKARLEQLARALRGEAEVQLLIRHQRSSELCDLLTLVADRMNEAADLLSLPLEPTPAKVKCDHGALCPGHAPHERPCCYNTDCTHVDALQRAIVADDSVACSACDARIKVNEECHFDHGGVFCMRCAP